MGEVSRDDLRDLGEMLVERMKDSREQILREVATGFYQVHARQDKTNGRIDHLQQTAAAHDQRLISIERLRLAAQALVVEDEPGQSTIRRIASAVSKSKKRDEDEESTPVTRGNVKLILLTIAAIAGVVQFIFWFVGQFRGGGHP